MCIRSYSESGHGGRFDPCDECKSLQEENQLLRAENANLSMAHGPGNHTDWMLTRASKYEQLHKDLEKLRQELDRLAGIVEKADALVRTLPKHDCSHGKDCYFAGCDCEDMCAAAKAYQEARHAG